MLLILAAGIVGAAILVGINSFSGSSTQANQEAVIHDIMNIAARAQAWYRRPAAMGGGGRNFAGLNGHLERINFPSSNLNGSYSISGGDASTCTIIGTGLEDGNGDGVPLVVTVVITPDSIRSLTMTP
ncbi:MAG: hypothetical protein ONB48_09260 [candidate division KSB1 bacterium]|nr:hypothetical protein [candidate division KSB1 bacterium]MDZ7298863.1 hypothetical protein [candidate division KSB1 bacterium]MDZ7307091.1 hypothetical protein [candidate division KSB1 bacterium]MDZ7349992.1 hypothetical protein [candidate division KSB1 bacterium]MDZ7396995.1 hypothetical protein [candidate division KSB1 bacterium]